MDERLTKIAQLNPAYFAFISGIAVSVAANLITGLAIERYGRSFGLHILVAAFLFLATGVIFMVLSWNLEEPYTKWKTISRNLGWSEIEIRRVAVNGKAHLLWSLMLIGALLFLLGFIVLFA